MFDCKQLENGGGGYITGLLSDPHNKDVLYARCDVGGVYKSMDGGKSFTAKNKGMTHPAQHCVESFALSPHDSRILFRCSGEAANHHSFGFIHRSKDGGESWELLTEQLDYIGNGETRNCGEMIQVDPFHPHRVVAASDTRGIFVSEDMGETWNFSGLKGEPLKAVCFHPEKENVVYAGTLDMVLHEDYLYPGKGYREKKEGKLYRSLDGGKTFELLFTSHQISFADLTIKDGKILAAGGLHGVFISEDEGKSFRRTGKGLPEASYANVCFDIHRKGRVYISVKREVSDDHVPVIPLYVSDNYGEDFVLLHAYTADCFSDYPEDFADTRPIGWQIAAFIPDAFEKNRLFMSNWFGVSTSEDGGRTWSGNHFKGIENVCMEAITRRKGEEASVFVTLADKQMLVSHDDGEHFEPVQTAYLPRNYYCSKAVVASAFDHHFVLYGGHNNHNIAAALFCSRDNGKTAECLWELEEGLDIQGLKEDPFHPGWFYLYIDGELVKGAGFYSTKDWGKTWAKGGNPFPDYINRVPLQKELIENEVLAVTWYQTKNATGCNKLLKVSPKKEGRIYLGEWTEGIFCSEDFGASWKQVGGGLPLRKNYRTILNVIETDEENADILYAGLVGEGLWKTTDNGLHWEQLLDQEGTNISDLAINGSEIFAAAESMRVNPCQAAIYHSTDSGVTWENIYDGSKGCIRIKGISFNPGSKRLIAITCGNGAFSFQLKGERMNEKDHLIISENKRYLTKKGDTPFFWLGDTAWELFHRLTKEEAEEFLSIRKEQGFNVIQAVVLAEDNGLVVPNAYGRVPLLKSEDGIFDPLKWDEEGDYSYWDHVDYIISLAESMGIYIALLPTWGDKYSLKWGVGPEIFSGESAEEFGRRIAQRMNRFHNIIWVVGGDRNPENRTHFEVIVKMAEGIRQEDRNQNLMTFHPQGGFSSSTAFHAESWLDFNMIQSGHMELNGKNYLMVEKDYQLQPAKPTLDGEPRYEDHPINFNITNGYFDQADIRQAAYWSVFSGSFGHTYGHHSVWHMCTGEEATGYFISDWKTAMTRPGGKQMGFLRWLMEQNDFIQGKPAQELIEMNYEGANYMTAFMGKDFALVYSPNGLPIHIRKDMLKGKELTAQWFSPRNGKVTTCTDEEEYYPPTQGRNEDWVLWLRWNQRKLSDN